MYAIGISPCNLVNIVTTIVEDSCGKISYFNMISYNIMQSKCTLFVNKCDAEKCLEKIKDKNNILHFENKDIFKDIDNFSYPEPKIEDLKIYRLNVEEVK